MEVLEEELAIKKLQREMAEMDVGTSRMTNECQIEQRRRSLDLTNLEIVKVSNGSMKGFYVSVFCPLKH